MPPFLLFLALAASQAPAGAASSDDAFARGLPSVEAVSRLAASGEPVQGRAVDATGRPVSPEAWAAYQRIISSLKGRKLSPDDQDFLLAVLNLPPMDPGPFRSREELARHFAQAGVAPRNPGGAALTGSDLWRLVRAARAAAQAYRIPPAILLCLTFRESGFDRRASAWTTSAKGVAQMTNGAVEDAVALIRRDPGLRAATEAYARELGAKMPDKVVGAPDVDALTRELDLLRKTKAPASDIEEKRLERQRAIRSHKDEPGHIFNLETNFGLGAVYLANLRRARLAEVKDERRGWLTTVLAFNQGLGFANALIYDVFKGPADYNARSLDELFNSQTASRLKLSPERQHEMLGEVGSVRSCACP